jgi:ADP-ribosyl-[dinitrogen reductase] hydrolase
MADAVPGCEGPQEPTGHLKPHIAGEYDMTTIDRSRARGTLIGLAVGDSVGVPLEFSSQGTFAPVADMLGGGPFSLRPGEWTDDTSMALCLAESILECRGMNARDQLERYVRWWTQGHLSSTGRCFDIGNTVRRALDHFLQTGEVDAGPTDAHSAGNGSLMRLAPAAIYYARHPARALDACARSSRTTHGARVAVDACRYLGALLVGAMHGASKEELLGDHYSLLPGYWEDAPLDPVIAVIARGSFRKRSPP